MPRYLAKVNIDYAGVAIVRRTVFTTSATAELAGMIVAGLVMQEDGSGNFPGVDPADIDLTGINVNALFDVHVPYTGIPVRLAVRDLFARPDGGVDGTPADTGGLYRAIPDARILGGTLAAPVPSSGISAVTYVRQDLGGPMRTMAAKFKQLAGIDGGGTGITLINTADGTTNFVVGNNWLHFYAGLTGWTLSWVTNVAGTVTLTTIDQGSYPAAIVKDGTTVYGAAMEIRGTQLAVLVWNDTTGAVLSSRVVDDPHVATFRGNFCIWEPGQGDATHDASRIVAVSASVDSSALPGPVTTRGEVAAIIAASIGDPLGIGYATNVPPFVPLVAQAHFAANACIISRLLADSVIGAQHIDFTVGVSSGNICVGVYRQVGITLVRLATSGSVACPAAGPAHVVLDVPVTAKRATDFVALVASNTTATFYGAAGSGQITGSNGANGVGVLFSTFPLPAGPLGPTWYQSAGVDQMLLVA